MALWWASIVIVTKPPLADVVGPTGMRFLVSGVFNQSTASTLPFHPPLCPRQLTFWRQFDVINHRQSSFDNLARWSMPRQSHTDTQTPMLAAPNSTTSTAPPLATQHSAPSALPAWAPLSVLKQQHYTREEIPLYTVPNKPKKVSR